MTAANIVISLAMASMTVIPATAGVTVIDSRLKKQNIDKDWLFTVTRDDIGNDVTEQFNTIDLPHDWSIANDFNSRYAMGNDGGYLPSGAGKYVKTLYVSDEDLKDKHLLYVEGAYMNAHVYANDSLVGINPYGFSSAFFDLTPYLTRGENNLVITVDNTRQKNARWYTGSGIYRHVWLYNLATTAVKPWSLYVTTPVVGVEGSDVEAVFDIAGMSGQIKAYATITDSDGNKICDKEAEIVDAHGHVLFTDCPLALWDTDTPNLYEMEITLSDKDNRIIDRELATFGVRDISYSSSEGFMLNGKPMTFNGACVHSDNAFLGARSYDAAERRKVRLLKEAGFNAVRTSHNHPSEAFLNECDRQGLMVIDEAFDGWRHSKTSYDYSTLIDEWWEKDLTALVARDRNHPSIICWSIGNEVIERKQIEVVKTAAKMAGLCRRLDPTRPVTSALCAWDPEWDIYDPLAAVHDIVGYNYMIHKSEEDHARVPERIMWQTESYPRDAFANWCKVKDYPYIIGDFVWTGIDYLGESGIGRCYYEGDSPGEHFEHDQWPWHASYCGDIDLTGHRKPISYYREILHSSTPSIYMAVREPYEYFGKIKETMWSTYPTWESWSWPGHEGKQIDVEVISSYPAVRLYINNEPVGDRFTTRDEQFKAVFSVPYTPGSIKAVPLNADGIEIGTPVIITTASRPVAIRLKSDRDIIDADGQDLAFITAEIVDKDGNIVPYADNEILFTVSGSGSLAATGSADIKDCSGYHNPERKAWKGRALAIVKAADKSGKVRLTAKAKGLHGTSLTLKVK